MSGPSPQLLSEFDGTVWLSAKSAPLLGMLPAAAEDASGRAAIYAVDTMGNLFMRYSADPDIKKLSNDCSACSGIANRLKHRMIFST